MVNYSSIALEAEHAIKEEISGLVNWRFQGKINRDYAIKNRSNTEVGFLLVEKKAGCCTWHLVQKKILSGLNNSNHLLDSVIMVPGRLTTTNHLLVSSQSSKHLPTKGEVKLLAYLVQDNHYYISQMQYFVSNGIDHATQASTPPPTIRDYSLKLASLEIMFHKAERGAIRDVTLKGLAIDFLTNGLLKKWPNDVKGYLLIQKKETTNLSDLDCHKVAALFKKLKPGQNSAINKDGQMCLIANDAQKIDPLCLPFFSTNDVYTFFICGFSERDKTFQYYRDLSSNLVKIREKQVPFWARWNYTRRAQRSAASTPVISEPNASQAISADILDSASTAKESPKAKPEDMNQVEQEFYDRSKCRLGGSLFNRSVNLEEIIYTYKDKDKDKNKNEDPDKLAEYVSNYLKNPGEKKYNQNDVLVFKEEDIDNFKTDLGKRYNTYYHWSVGLDKLNNIKPEHIELCRINHSRESNN